MSNQTRQGVPEFQAIGSVEHDRAEARQKVYRAAWNTRHGHDVDVLALLTAIVDMSETYRDRVKV